LSEDYQQLHIIHTNDIHSRFEQMPRIASVIQYLKQSRPDESVITLDIGDHMDRMRVETEGSMGAANIAVLNASGYDAVVLGNNEGLTFPKEAISAVYSGQTQFAVLGTNLLDAESGTQVEWMVPSLVIEKGNLRIGIVGVTAFYENFYSLLGWTALEPFQAIRAEIHKLRTDEHVHLIIVMSHLGLRQDRMLAHEIEGIDLILGGHTHHLLEQPEKEDRTWLAATGSLGKYVGDITLGYHFSTGELTLVQGRCLSTEQFPIDEQVAQLIESYYVLGRDNLSQPVAHLEHRLSIDWYGESQLGNLLAAGIHRWTDAEIGLVNAGQLLSGLEAGPVTAGQLLSMCPSPINPCVTQLQGTHIRQALEESLIDEFYEYPIRGFGFRGQVLGVLCVSGIIIEYNPVGERFNKISNVQINGEPLDEERMYRVGMIDMFTFGIGYTSLSQGVDTHYYLPEFIRDILEVQLQRPDELLKCARSHWVASGL
jgi:2',3'-cyclic-nucleotide 2'-phosphodiesterase (5'-nucleotidase family)